MNQITASVIMSLVRFYTVMFMKLDFLAQIVLKGTANLFWRMSLNLSLSDVSS